MSDLNLVKSKKRVADHGEVFTPSWMVQAMLDTVKHESERIDSKFLEPACGSGNFLVAVFLRKLATVQNRYGSNTFEKNHHAMLALMSIYGIELLSDNTTECRSNLLEIFTEFLDVAATDEVVKAAQNVLEANIVQGDALAMLSAKGDPLEFPEWAYLGKGKFSRRDFRFDSLTLRASFSGTLFDLMPEEELFIPVRDYPRMTMVDIANLSSRGI